MVQNETLGGCTLTYLFQVSYDNVDGQKYVYRTDSMYRARTTSELVKFTSYLFW